MERRLGRGLGSLLGESKEKEAEPREVPLNAIRPNPHQPREVFRPEELEELRDSIRNHGILQPLVLRRMEDHFELIAGERRWRAAGQAGLSHVPAVIRDDVSEGDMLELALVENVQRQDLNAIERARGYRQLIERLELTQEQVAKRVGLRRASIANHLRLLELPDKVQMALASGLISMGHGRALLGLTDPQEQIHLAEEAGRKDLSVREVERRVRENHQPAPAGVPTEPKGESPPPWLREMQERMSQALGTRVQVHNQTGYRGRIVVEYFNRDDLERLYATLAPRESV